MQLAAGKLGALLVHHSRMKSPAKLVPCSGGPVYSKAMTLELLAHLDLSAASGLVHRDGFLYSVADDGLELLRTELDGSKPVRLPLSNEPSRTHIAKSKKPDFEALISVGTSLLAIGSGSTAARCLAISLEPETLVRRTIDLRPLYGALSGRIHELNIEGAVITDDAVFLAQRGNGARKENALIRLERAVFERELAGGTITAACLHGVIPVALDTFEGVSLSLTDLCKGPGSQLIFTAAAEATENPYDDGVVAGSIVGVIDSAGLVNRRISAPGVKLEGVCWLNGELRLVADPDDPSARAALFRVAWT